MISLKATLRTFHLILLLLLADISVQEETLRISSIYGEGKHEIVVDNPELEEIGVTEPWRSSDRQLPPQRPASDSFFVPPDIS